MENKLSGSTQIWADGYSFMEVTETLLMALGIRSNETRPSEPASARTEPTAAASVDVVQAFTPVADR